MRPFPLRNPILAPVSGFSVKGLGFAVWNGGLGFGMKGIQKRFRVWGLEPNPSACFRVKGYQGSSGSIGCHSIPTLWGWGRDAGQGGAVCGKGKRQGGVAGRGLGGSIRKDQIDQYQT